MGYGLIICGEESIPDPTEADIRHAVFSLDSSEDDAFLILEKYEMTYIQTSGDRNVGFDLEYQEGDVAHHYRAKRSLTADEICQAFVSYTSGTSEWQRIAEWERITW